MTYRLAPLLVVAIVLAAAAPAAAKEVMSVQVCGTERCVISEDEHVREVLMTGGSPAKPPGAAGRVVVLRASVGDGQSDEEMGSYRAGWLPRWRMLVFEDGRWARVSPQAEREFERLTSGLATFPPSQLRRLAEADVDLARPAREPQPPSRPAAAPSDADGLWWLLVPGAIALAFVGTLLLRRRRPGGAAPA